MQVYYFRDEKHNIDFLVLKKEEGIFWTTNYLDTVFKSEEIPLSEESKNKMKLVNFEDLPKKLQKQVFYLKKAAELNRSCDKKELEKLIKKVE